MILFQKKYSMSRLRSPVYHLKHTEFSACLLRGCMRALQLGVLIAHNVRRWLFAFASCLKLDVYGLCYALLSNEVVQYQYGFGQDIYRINTRAAYCTAIVVSRLSYRNAKQNHFMPVLTFVL